MKDNCINLLEMLGYNVEHKGCLLFVELVEDVKNMLDEGKTKEEIKKLLPSYYLEYYHFCYEVGRTKYMGLLNDFINSKKINEKNSTLNYYFNLDEGIGLEDSLISLGKYFKYVEDVDKHTKIMMKKFTHNLQN